MNLKLLQSNSALTLLLIAGAGGYMLGFYLPAANANRALQDEIVLKQQFVLDSARAAAQIRHTEQELQAAKNYIAEWTDRAPRLAEMPVVYSELSHATAASGAALVELEPRSATNHDHLFQVPVAFGCRGSHGQLFSLLARIEQLPRLIWIEELKLGQSAGNAEMMQCEMVLGVFGGKSEKTDYAESAGGR